MCQCSEMVLFITILFVAFCVSNSLVLPTCPPQKWLKDANDKFSCCDYCPPGQYMAQECNTVNRTVCKPCPFGTFTTNSNKYKICLSCSTCKDKFILHSKCSREADTVCVCIRGYFYIVIKHLCKSCRTCGKEEEVVRKCSQSNDSVCRMCQLGHTFSHNGHCRVCSKCRINEVKRENCSLTSDTVCEAVTDHKYPRKEQVNIYSVVTIVLVCSLVVGIVICAIYYRQRCTRCCTRPGELQNLQKRSGNADVKESCILLNKIPAVLGTTITPIASLDYPTVEKLGKLLDPKSPAANWKMLAAKMALSREEIGTLEHRTMGTSATSALIMEYESKHPDATIEELRQMLQEIGRNDAVNVASPYCIGSIV